MDQTLVIAPATLNDELLLQEDVGGARDGLVVREDLGADGLVGVDVEDEDLGGAVAAAVDLVVGVDGVGGQDEASSLKMFESI